MRPARVCRPASAARTSPCDGEGDRAMIARKALAPEMERKSRWKLVSPSRPEIKKPRLASPTVSDGQPPRDRARLWGKPAAKSSARRACRAGLTVQHRAPICLPRSFASSKACPCAGACPGRKRRVFHLTQSGCGPPFPDGEWRVLAARLASDGFCLRGANFRPGGKRAFRLHVRRGTIPHGDPACQ